MDIEEKRVKIEEYCKGRDCEDCPLVGHAPCYTGATDEQIEKNYRLAFGDDTPEPKPVYLPIGETNPVVENNPVIENDSVNHPSHYNDGKIEVIEYIEDQKLDFCLGNAIKYISRAGKKNRDKEVEDLKKAIWYIDRRIKQIERASEAVSDV